MFLSEFLHHQLQPANLERSPMKTRGFIGVLMGASILSLTPLWAQGLEKIVDSQERRED